jgi:Spy/CpxP family protein refolding chaperone
MNIARIYTPTRLFVAASMLAVATLASAGEHRDQCQPTHMHDVHLGMPPGGPEAIMPPLPPFLHGLNLSDAQEDEVFKLMHQQGPTLFEKSRTAHKAGEALRHMAMSGKFDPTRARTLADTIASANAELTLMHAETEARVIALLTPAQRKQMEEHDEEKAHSLAF